MYKDATDKSIAALDRNYHCFTTTIKKYGTRY